MAAGHGSPPPATATATGPGLALGPGPSRGQARSAPVNLPARTSSASSRAQVGWWWPSWVGGLAGNQQSANPDQRTTIAHWPGQFGSRSPTPVCGRRTSSVHDNLGPLVPRTWLMTGEPAFRHSGTVIVWRDQAKHAGWVPGQGQPGRGPGPAPAADLDRRGRQRPIDRGGCGRGAGPSLRWATATTTRATRSQDRSPARPAMRRGGTRAKHAGVPLRSGHAVEGAGRLFSTPSRPACGRPPAAAVLGRQQRFRANRRTVVELQPARRDPRHLPRGRLPTRQAVTKDEPHPSAELVPSPPGRGRVVLAGPLDRQSSTAPIWQGSEAAWPGSGSPMRPGAASGWE